MMKALAVLILVVNLVQGELAPIRFNQDGKFKIALLTDLHYGEGPEQDRMTDQVQRMVLEVEQPDFIVFNGDMVSGWKAKHQEGWFEKRWHRVIAQAQRLGIPYATILGNHDHEGDLDRRQILDLDIKTGNGLSYTQQGPFWVGGASNYYLEILPAKPSLNRASVSTQEYNIIKSEFLANISHLEAPAARLWFFDSMARGCAGFASGWGCVAHNTIQWARNVASRLSPVENSVLFVHIPLPETLKAWSVGEDVVGTKRESCNCPKYNTGLFKFAKDYGIGAIWSGHDHSNDYEAMLHGVRIGYGRKVGIANYGVLPHGARIIELKQGESAQSAASWITLWNGTRIFQQNAVKSFARGLQQERCRSPGQWPGSARTAAVAVPLLLGLMYMFAL